ncbi:MAG: AmmeMemoRadiSam system radical SAM enzyme [Planctomycetes bacterium]|nr:AmmeMemoRadiSam system radical SAM enzyme [Planctomycetota bacterium]
MALKEAILWEKRESQSVQCRLCHWGCVIKSGAAGRCRVRKNIDGVLYSLNYDKLCAANDDPIEKKPLFHFLPGSRTFSISAPGCNFQCVFCQNWQISQSPQENVIDGSAYSPQQIVDAAIESGCKSVAYTYTEPTVFVEICAETAVLAKQRGLYNVFVSNGYMSLEAVDFMKSWLDAINIDLKAFKEEFYKDLCKAHLAPVLETIRYIAQKTDIWLEITTLLVPGKNDSDDELEALAGFLVKECGPDMPWHISRFYPQYKMTDREPTDSAALQRAYDIGKKAGLRYVYVGNLPGNRAESTFCPGCGKILIERSGYRIIQNVIRDSACPYCGNQIAGIGFCR